jgi:hypothetical protein
MFVCFVKESSVLNVIYSNLIVLLYLEKIYLLFSKLDHLTTKFFNKVGPLQQKVSKMSL